MFHLDIDIFKFYWLTSNGNLYSAWYIAIVMQRNWKYVEIGYGLYELS